MSFILKFVGGIALIFILICSISVALNWNEFKCDYNHNSDLGHKTCHLIYGK